LVLIIGRPPVDWINIRPLGGACTFGVRRPCAPVMGAFRVSM
jgi:hypothetical protein